MDVIIKLPNDVIIIRESREGLFTRPGVTILGLPSKDVIEAIKQWQDRQPQLYDLDTAEKLGVATPAQVEAFMSYGDMDYILVDAHGTVASETRETRNLKLRKVYVAPP